MTQNKSKTLHTTDNRHNWCSRDPVIELGVYQAPGLWAWFLRWVMG